jgi:acetyl-CoA acetyltransferase
MTSLSRSQAFRDVVAILGTAEVGYVRQQVHSPLAMVVEASKQAIADAGLDRSDVNGICGTDAVSLQTLQDVMRFPRITWADQVPFHLIAAHGVSAAAYAIASGACETALVVWVAGLRQLPASEMGQAQVWDVEPLWKHSGASYAAWAGRYMRDYGVPREALGLIAINSRSNALLSGQAVLSKPITMTDYLAAPWINEPFCLLDMEIPVAGANAWILTSADRARASSSTPVYVHAHAAGLATHGTEQYEQARDYLNLANWHVARSIWERSDIGRDEIDVLFPYDGYTGIALTWLEALGYCAPGCGYDFVRTHWDDAQNRLLVNGRVPVQPMGGSLSKGGTQGASYFHEAVLQLRGRGAVATQVDGARSALIASGGFHQNATATILRA